MKLHYKLVLFLIFFILFGSTKAEESFTYTAENFIESAIKNYSTWLRGNVLDPTALKEIDVMLLNHTFTNGPLLCKLTDEKMTGHSQQITELSAFASVDFKRQLLHLELQTKGVIKFQGNYVADADRNRGSSFLGEGTWTYTSHDGLSENVTFRFSITPNRTLNISEGRQEYTLKPLGKTEVELEGVLEDKLGGDEREMVKQTFLQEYEKQRIQSMHPDNMAPRLFQQYLNQALQKLRL